MNGVYEKLKEKSDYQKYLLDIQLAVLNKYVEFIEAGEDEDNWYKEHAIVLAKIKKFMVLANICDFNETPCGSIESML